MKPVTQGGLYIYACTLVLCTPHVCTVSTDHTWVNGPIQPVLRGALNIVSSPLQHVHIHRLRTVSTGYTRVQGVCAWCLQTVHSAHEYVAYTLRPHIHVYVCARTCRYTHICTNHKHHHASSGSWTRGSAVRGVSAPTYTSRRPYCGSHHNRGCPVRHVWALVYMMQEVQQAPRARDQCTSMCVRLRGGGGRISHVPQPVVWVGGGGHFWVAGLGRDLEGGGGGQLSATAPSPPPLSDLGEFFLRAFDQSRIFSDAFGTS